MMSQSWRELLGREIPCECGRAHRVPTQEVLLGGGVAEAIAEVAARHTDGRRLAVIADLNTWEVAGRRVAGLLAAFSPAQVILTPAHAGHDLKADDHSLERLQAALPEADLLVSVGSGTVNDLTKLAATARAIPSVCVATAPSMNGYPSAIAAITRAGIKCTVPCEPPVAILCDTDILCGAPEAMIQAGFGDLLSKSTSAADWLMAHLLRGEYFCHRPLEVVEEAERECIRQAGAIGRRESAGIAALAEGLIQSGMSMAMAGASSPASGGEHLISHYWDMTASAQGRESDLHGRQVAVATVAAGRLWAAVREATTGGLDLNALPAGPSLEELQRRSREHFVGLLGAEAAEEVAQLVGRKWESAEGLKARLKPMAEDPEGFWGQLGRYLRAPEDTAAAYHAAGAPTTPGEVGVSTAQARGAFIFARHIRDRYTVLDLADALGLLEGMAPGAFPG
jgi:glycerol-1-phosphate dehydrogenase [NAD(P)+]